jgi:hypothetical protein
MQRRGGRENRETRACLTGVRGEAIGASPRAFPLSPRERIAVVAGLLNERSNRARMRYESFVKGEHNALGSPLI